MFNLMANLLTDAERDAYERDLIKLIVAKKLHVEASNYSYHIYDDDTGKSQSCSYAAAMLLLDLQIDDCPVCDKTPQATSDRDWFLIECPCGISCKHKDLRTTVETWNKLQVRP